jgi:hypothetical protein
MLRIILIYSLYYKVIDATENLTSQSIRGCVRYGHCLVSILNSSHSSLNTPVLWKPVLTNTVTNHYAQYTYIYLLQNGTLFKEKRAVPKSGYNEAS